MSPLALAFDYGYEETKLSARYYRVSYLGPIQRASLRKDEREKEAEPAGALAEDLAMWRAAELATGQGYPAFTIVDTESEIEVTIEDIAPIGYGPVYGSPHYGWRSRRLGPSGPRYRTARLRAKATLLVVLEDEAVEGAYDAAETARRLRAQYSDAKAKPAETPELTY